jgi:hypothetical protein
MVKQLVFSRQNPVNCESMAQLTIHQVDECFSVEVIGLGDSLKIANQLVEVFHAAIVEGNAMNATEEPDVPAEERCGQSSDPPSQPEQSSVI